MKLKINSKKNNALVGREDVEFEIDGFEKTPSRKEIREKIVSETGSKPELVAIGKMRQSFGEKRVSGTAAVYPDRKAMERAEKRHIIERTEGKKPKEAEKAKKK